jgi:hypothetical protein
MTKNHGLGEVGGGLYLPSRQVGLNEVFYFVRKLEEGRMNVSHHFLLC